MSEQKSIELLSELLIQGSKVIKDGVDIDKDSQTLGGIAQELTQKSIPKNRTVTFKDNLKAKELARELQKYELQTHLERLKELGVKYIKDKKEELIFAAILGTISALLIGFVKIPPNFVAILNSKLIKLFSVGLSKTGVVTSSVATATAHAIMTTEVVTLVGDISDTLHGGMPFVTEDSTLEKFHYAHEYADSKAEENAQNLYPSDPFARKIYTANPSRKRQLAEEYKTKIKLENQRLRDKHGITDENITGFQAEYIVNNKNLEKFIDSRKANRIGIDLSLDGNQVSISQQAQTLQTVPNKPVTTNDNTSDPNTWKKITNSLWKFPTAKFEETTVKGDSKAQTNTTKKKKARKSNQYVNISREELRAKYKAHRAREIQNDPSMEYFYSSKYQEEHQNMFGTISCSNINPSEAHNFSSPVGGSFTSPFSSLSNEIAPFKIPPFLTIDDILRNPKIKEFTQAGNEAHKQLCSYDRELHESFQDESPLSDEDRSTMEDMHDLVDCLRKYES